jgi:hypothetical protein
MRRLDRKNPTAGRRLGRLACGVAAAALLAAACSSGEDDGADGDATPPAAEQSTVRLLIRDGSLRVDGSPCAGSGGLIYIHRSASFRVENGRGEELASGELPAGKAVKALEEDFGNARRIPTNCEFSFAVPVGSSASYRLVLDGKAPIELTAQDDPEEGRLLVGLVP